MFWLFSITRCCCRASAPEAYCLGGYGGASSPFTEWRNHDGYYSTTDVWQSRANLPTPGRQAHGGSVLNQLGYAVGGQSSTGEIQNNDEYNPTADTWVSRAVLPAPSRNFMAAVGALSSVYAFGGFHQAGGPNGYLDYVLNNGYTPVSDSWSSKADMPAPSRRSGASVAVVGKVYSWGGYDGDTTQFGGSAMRDNDEYETSANSWTSRTDLPTPARYKIQGGASVGARGYVVGGAQSELSGQHNGLDDCDEFDPSTNTWTSKSGSGLNRAMLAVTQTNDGLVHTFGGSHQTTFFSSSHQCYDPATDAWLSKAGVPAPPRTNSAAFGM